MPANAPNPNDGTVLGTAEVISDEFIDPATGCRRDPNIPGTGYKMPRSKIAVGPYGQDHGDATPDRPLPVEAHVERRLRELEMLQLRDNCPGQRYSFERQQLSDSRGGHLKTRGVR